MQYQNIFSPKKEKKKSGTIQNENKKADEKNQSYFGSSLITPTNVTQKSIMWFCFSHPDQNVICNASLFFILLVILFPLN